MIATNTTEVLNRGMTSLLERMDIVEAEHFIFLVKAENFDYTQWQRDYFDSKNRDELDREMKAYFASHPYRGDAAKVI